MKAVFAKVDNRGVPPEKFLGELVAWAREAPDSIFEVNLRRDIYSLVKPVMPTLGPFKSITHRKAIMCEVLRVLAGFESSWRWNEGRDKANPNEVDVETWSVGAFQISPNSRWLDPSLLRYLRNRYGMNASNSELVTRFRADMVSDHRFACAYATMLLRVNLNHNGPVKRGEILPWLSREAVAEFEALLT